LKGLIATLLISTLYFGDITMPLHWLKIIAGFSAIIGHIFPVWIGFKGGKGVATAAGVLLGLMPLEVGFGILLFILIVYSICVSGFNSGNDIYCNSPVC